MFSFDVSISSTDIHQKKLVLSSWRAKKLPCQESLLLYQEPKERSTSFFWWKSLVVIETSMVNKFSIDWNKFWLAYYSNQMNLFSETKQECLSACG